MSRVRPTAGPTMSLFPFLAVLLCTMGALLVLLVLFSRAAQESEQVREQAAHQARGEELEQARDELAWRLSHLEAIRGQTAADLSRARMQLAGAEDDIRRLEDEFAALERTLATGAEAGQPGEPDPRALADLEERLTAARAALDEARRDRDSKRPAYAVVPYEGQQGTGRRPLYIECCIDGVFLQPEGIRLGPADFDGPPGPGNPLACALRAAREHIARTDAGGGDPGRQPYPLLLVRPSGVMAYYAAREAIGSWGSEFGYQFVDEDWELAFPPVDPTLAEVERRAVEESRRRLAWLMQVRPARPERPQPQYRAASTRGGVEPLGGPSVLGDRSRFAWRENDGAAAAAASSDGMGNGTGSGDVATGGMGTGGGAGDGEDRGGAGGSAAALVAIGGVGADGAVSAGGIGAGGTGEGGTGGYGTERGSRFQGPTKFYASGGDASVGEGSAGGGTPGQAGSDGGAARGTAAGSGNASGHTGSRFSQMSPAGAGGGEGSGGSGSAAQASGRMGSDGGGGSGPSLPGQPQQGGGGAATVMTGADQGGSLASGRGSNWASLATQERPIPLTRPIRVECAGDEFRLLDDSGRRVEARIPIGPRTADAVDPLVKAVHARVAEWGIAGDRMYWRPELVLSETPDGHGRRADLERLLADSGLDTRVPTEPPAVRPLPPVHRTGGVFPRR